ncbi:30S ribosomal protein S11 [Patescibacteria group bacterium]
MAKPNKNNKTKKRRIVKAVPQGRMYVTATFNNTLATITDAAGNTLCWGSTGKAGFSGSRKSTPYAATVSLDRVLNEAKEFGIRELEVFIKGPGPGRDAALRVLRESGIKIAMIADVTPIPHNGTRPRKKKHNR